MLEVSKATNVLGTIGINLREFSLVIQPHEKTNLKRYKLVYSGDDTEITDKTLIDAIMLKLSNFVKEQYHKIHDLVLTAYKKGNGVINCLSLLASLRQDIFRLFELDNVNGFYIRKIKLEVTSYIMSHPVVKRDSDNRIFYESQLAMLKKLLESNLNSSDYDTWYRESVVVLTGVASLYMQRDIDRKILIGIHADIPKFILEQISRLDEINNRAIKTKLMFDLLNLAIDIANPLENHYRREQAILLACIQEHRNKEVFLPKYFISASLGKMIQQSLPQVFSQLPEGSCQPEKGFNRTKNTEMMLIMEACEFIKHNKKSHGITVLKHLLIDIQSRTSICDSLSDLNEEALRLTCLIDVALPTIMQLTTRRSQSFSTIPTTITSDRAKHKSPVKNLLFQTANLIDKRSKQILKQLKKSRQSVDVAVIPRQMDYLTSELHKYITAKKKASTTISSTAVSQSDALVSELKQAIQTRTQSQTTLTFSKPNKVAKTTSPRRHQSMGRLEMNSSSPALLAELKTTLARRKLRPRPEL